MEDQTLSQMGAEDSSEKVYTIRLAEETIEIKELDFFGKYSRSHNGKLILAWADEPKYFVLLEDLAEGSDGPPLSIFAYDELGMDSPENGKVADTGVFIFNDNQGTLEPPVGVFFVFYPNSGMFFSQEFGPFLINNGISSDARFAVCSTAGGGPDPDESFVICVFDLEHKAILSKFKPVIVPARGWPREYVFEPEKQVLHLIYDDYLVHRYSFDGNFLDEERWENDRLYIAKNSPYGYDFLEIALKQLHDLDSSNLRDYSRVLDLLDQSLSKQVSPNTQARIHRTLGEIYYRCSSYTTALEHLNTALELNPKVGVQRLLKRIKNLA